jgi:hypothetical protein
LENFLDPQTEEECEIIDQQGGPYTHWKTSSVLSQKRFVGYALDVKNKRWRVWEDDLARYTWDGKTPEIEVFDFNGVHLGANHPNTNKKIGQAVKGRKMQWKTLKRIK